MSHTATYTVCIAKASREITESVLNWMKEKGLITKVEVYQYGTYGTFISAKQFGYYSIRMDIQNGKIHFSGEESIIRSMDFEAFQKMFTDIYTATVYRLALAQNGYRTEMTLNEMKGQKVIDIVGVQ